VSELNDRARETKVKHDKTKNKNITKPTDVTDEGFNDAPWDYQFIEYFFTTQP